jgi:hypothetical protein
MAADIFDLEMRHLLPEFRGSQAELDRLLSEEFTEVGSSGTIYTKQELLQASLLDSELEFHVSDFKAREFGNEVILTTYRLEKVREGVSEGASLRSSIWRLGSEGWQLVFHQGTKVDEPGI